MIAHLFFEVKEDKIVRQVEQYGECWVYSGDSGSVCLDCEGMKVFGSRGEIAFSALRFGELPASMQNRQAEFEEGWRGIEVGDFEMAWETASRLAVPMVPSEDYRHKLSAPTIELQEEMIESTQRVADACKRGLNRPELKATDREYLENLLARTEADLRHQRTQLEKLRL